MPRWADLRIFLTADFDLGSAITFAFGLKAFWLEPLPFGAANPVSRQNRPWQARAFVVDYKNLPTEQRELLALLNYINDILTNAQQRNASTTVQFYLWDTLQFDHLKRVIGRHLNAILNNQVIQHLAWLFPPEELLPNPALSTRASPITIVRDVVRSQLAAPISHYYTLLEVARNYHPADTPPTIAQFSVHPLFENELSDQIPSERAHEIWSRSTSTTRGWLQQMRVLTETIERRLSALEAVTRRLEDDLRPTLGQTAPQIRIAPPAREARLSYDGQLWYLYARLNEAVAELEVSQKRAMPPHEREARFHSARLAEQLTGHDEQAALALLNLQGRAGRRVYRMRPGSREVKLKAGDFNFALAPESDAGFLDKKFGLLTRNTNLEPPQDNGNWHVLMAKACGVTVVAIDRDHLLIALDPSNRFPGVLAGLEQLGLADFRQDACLDPVHQDMFTRKLLDALQAIGNPPIARNDPLVRRATGQTAGRGSRQTFHTPPADVLWNASGLYGTHVARELAPVRARLQEAGYFLNDTQWAAWEQSLSRRLQLIWGPPGTGKSRTARTILLGAALEAHQQHRPLRVLISATTYTAMDNVLLDVYSGLQKLLPSDAYSAYRLRSYLRLPEATTPPEIDVDVNHSQPSQRARDLIQKLKHPNSIVVVGSPPEQIFNLLTMNGGNAQQDLFDFILLDEATQTDVAHAILALCALASDGCVVLAGDPKQLPPIHPAEPPLGLESLVGSIYRFCLEFHKIPQVALDINYRSSDVLVEFARNSGYPASLQSHSRDLRLNVVSPLPNSQPSDWPSDSVWTPEWTALADPDKPATCFLYSDGRSSQWNLFEAEAVVSVLTMLSGRLGSQLLNEVDSHGAPITVQNNLCTPEQFWGQAVGVVTPHRAQQGLIVSRLQKVFATTTPELIRDAVDTVERFQGQERDVIIASFALGDPDAIQDEEEFLMSLNRFNVMASRARAKLIVLISQQVVDHLSSDLLTLRDSRLLKYFVEGFCTKSRPMTLSYLEAGVPTQVTGLFRWR